MSDSLKGGKPIARRSFLRLSSDFWVTAALGGGALLGGCGGGVKHDSPGTGTSLLPPSTGGSNLIPGTSPTPAPTPVAGGTPLPVGSPSPTPTPVPTPSPTPLPTPTPVPTPVPLPIIDTGRFRITGVERIDQNSNRGRGRQNPIATGGSVWTVINNQGQVAYTTFVYDGTGHDAAFIWEQGQSTLIPNLGNKSFIVRGINQQGWVSGFGVDYRGNDLGSTGLLYANGQTTSPFTKDFMDANCDINDVGHLTTNIGSIGPAIWFADGDIRKLAIRENDYFAYAIAINNSDQVTGFSLSDGQQRGVVWEKDTVRTLKAVAGGISNYPIDINDAGWVIGSVGGGTWLWRETDVLTIPEISTPYAINNRGIIAGTNNTDALLWEDGRITNLNDGIPAESGIHLHTACGINDHGQAIALGHVPNLWEDVLFFIDPK